MLGRVDAPGLFKVALFYGEALDWGEITPEAAAERSSDLAAKPVGTLVVEVIPQ